MGKHLVNGMPANPDIGDIYYDISDGRIKVPGDTAVHVFGGGKGVNPLWCGRVSSSGVGIRVSGTLIITVNRSGEGVYGIKGAPGGRTVIVSPLDYFVGSAPLVKAPHIAVVSQSSTGILTVRMYTLDGTLDDFGFSLMII